LGVWGGGGLMLTFVLLLYFKWPSFGRKSGLTEHFLGQNKGAIIRRGRNKKGHNNEVTVLNWWS